jgi:hypothetical protein
MIGFKRRQHDLGGVIGAIGVSNIEKSIEFYKTILGLDTYFMISKSMKIIIISKVGLHKSATGKGAFNKLLEMLRLN